jgi:hypothetical protein
VPFGGIEREEEEIERLLKRLLECCATQAALLSTIAETLNEILELLTPPVVQSTTAVQLIGGTMPITVGATDDVDTITFVDASGNPQAPPPGDGSGLTVTVTSSDDTVVTVGTATASGDTAVVPLTPVAPGSFTLSCVIANTSGAELFDADGTTPFVQPADVSDTVVAAPAPQATTATQTISGS